VICTQALQSGSHYIQSHHYKWHDRNYHRGVCSEQWIQQGRGGELSLMSERKAHREHFNLSCVLMNEKLAGQCICVCTYWGWYMYCVEVLCMYTHHYVHRMCIWKNNTCKDHLRWLENRVSVGQMREREAREAEWGQGPLTSPEL
jgi:hypothetical protein